MIDEESLIVQTLHPSPKKYQNANGSKNEFYNIVEDDSSLYQTQIEQLFSEHSSLRE